MRTWTSLLLTPSQVDAIAEARNLSVVSRLGATAKFEVAAVTGANAYFCVNREVVEEYDLEPWTVPLLPRVRHAEGLRYKLEDHKATAEAGAKAYLLDFSADRPDPEARDRPASYLDVGEAADLHKRYKTRIREPWYRVPYIRPEPLLLSKRSHYYPRVILNESEAVTTDTIYRGRLTPESSVGAADFVASFHNSLTLASAEMEGRSFGGGVLELVPSEVSRLLVPLVPGMGCELEYLDDIARRGETENLVEKTDELLLKADIGFSQSLLDDLASSRGVLLQRRLDRSGGSATLGQAVAEQPEWQL
jgi:adenine-specific DNA-methyltransferase